MKMFITYHGATRGVRSVAFLDHSQPEINEDKEPLKSFDVMQNNVSSALYNAKC